MSLCAPDLKTGIFSSACWRPALTPHIGILKEALIDYRTAPASFNLRSMEKRLELMEFLINKHKAAYQKHMIQAILGIESISMSRLRGWEEEISHGLEKEQSLSRASQDFMEHPTYGDGGMAAAVRIASLKAPVTLVNIENIYTFNCSVCAALSLWSQSYARQIRIKCINIPKICLM